MKPLFNRWTIVVAGNWNPAIFSPNFIGKKLLNIEKIGGEYNVSANQVGIVFHAESLLLIPSNDKLIVGIKNGQKETLEMAEKAMIDTLTLLEHTPVAALGINLAFEETDDLSDIKKLFAFEDHSKILMELTGCKIAGSEIKRTYQLDKYSLNLRVENNDNNIKIHFNYHHQSNSPKDMANALKNSFWRYRNEAVEFSKNVYGFEYEEENIHD